MKNVIEKKALKFCIDNKHRLTDPRRRVLQVIVASEKPIKAYEILDKISKIAKKPKPPTIYRAIQFWHSNNFIHRIESLNAYSACMAEHFHKGSQFLICDECGKVIETHFCELPSDIRKSTKLNTFTPTRWNLEVKGTCGKCS